MAAPASTPRRSGAVEDAILALDYVPNRVARGLISQKTRTIGLIVPDVVNPFFAPVVRGAETTARKAGYRVLLCNSEGDLRLEREYIEDLVAHRVEGLLLAPASDRSRHQPASRCCGAGFPIVLLDRALPDIDCDLVVSDSVAGARRLVEHLIAIGHRRIAHFTDSDDVSTGRDRLRGYREALEAAGIAYSEELVFRTTVDRIGGYRAAQQMLALDPLPTAIFTVNNMTAVGAMQASARARPVGAAGHGSRLLRRCRAPGGAVAVPDRDRPAGRDVRQPWRAAAASSASPARPARAAGASCCRPTWSCAIPAACARASRAGLTDDLRGVREPAIAAASRGAHLNRPEDDHEIELAIIMPYHDRQCRRCDTMSRLNCRIVVQPTILIIQSTHTVFVDRAEIPLAISHRS